MSISSTQRGNLSKLATYLESLPDDYQEFDMSTFYRKPDFLAREKFGDYKTEGSLCGSVACALGHGVLAGISPDNSSIDGEMKWFKYTTNFVPYNSDMDTWLFGEDWADIDNTVKGAAARIRYLLDDNFIPNLNSDLMLDEPEYMLELYKEYL